MSLGQKGFVGLAMALALVCVVPRAAIAAENDSRPDSKNLVSLQIVQDFGLHQGVNPCSISSQISGGFACFRASGTQYHGTPLADPSGDISAAPQFATTRILAGYDRILKEHFSLGARIGWVLRGGGPRPDGAFGPNFLPFHGEIRIGYTFGHRPFQHDGFHFTVFLDGGIAQVDTAYRITVKEDTSQPPPAAQLDNPNVQELDVYRKTGTGFLGAGATLTYMISRRVGISLAPKIMRLFPSPGTILSLEAGAAMAF